MLALLGAMVGLLLTDFLNLGYLVSAAISGKAEDRHD
jgi:uncharacterized membrane protein YgaE (UPF0421/DUF939 family)